MTSTFNQLRVAPQPWSRKAVCAIGAIPLDQIRKKPLRAGLLKRGQRLPALRVLAVAVARAGFCSSESPCGPGAGHHRGDCCERILGLVGRPLPTQRAKDVKRLLTCAYFREEVVAWLTGATPVDRKACPLGPWYSKRSMDILTLVLDHVVLPDAASGSESVSSRGLGTGCTTCGNCASSGACVSCVAPASGLCCSCGGGRKRALVPLPVDSASTCASADHDAGWSRSDAEAGMCGAVAPRKLQRTEELRIQGDSGPGELEGGGRRSPAAGLDISAEDLSSQLDQLLADLGLDAEFEVDIGDFAHRLW